MKNRCLLFLTLMMSLLCFPAFSQTEVEAGKDSTLLGLPGDNLDLYAVLNLFQKSPTIEDFEKSLNDQKTGINNLDLNLDTKVDFIKVQTKQNDKDFTFVLQVDVTEKETQDVAVILVSKDQNDKVTMQIVGDQNLYGKDYVIEPKPAAPPVTPNPAFTGTAPAPSTTSVTTQATTSSATPVTTPVTTSTTVVVVESAPIVQYVYSPVYVPYYPPYTYAYHPPYYAAFTVMAVSAYHHNCYPYHGGYHGGYGNTTVVVHNTNNYNNYNNSRNSSNTVNNNRNNGNYNNNNAAAHPSNGSSSQNRASTSPSTNQSKGSSSARQSTSPSASQTKSSATSPKASSTRSYGGRGGGGRRR